MLLSAVQSDGFVIIPESVTVLPVGETVTVYRY